MATDPNAILAAAQRGRLIEQLRNWAMGQHPAAPAFDAGIANHPLVQNMQSQMPMVAQWLQNRGGQQGPMAPAMPQLPTHPFAPPPAAGHGFVGPIAPAAGGGLAGAMRGATGAVPTQGAPVADRRVLPQ